MTSKQRIYNRILSRSFSGTKFFLIGAIVLMAASCKKESPIGSDIQPSGDLIDLQSADSVTLKTYTVHEDSLRSDEPLIVQIGDLNDPIFGNTKASLFTQFVIPNGLTSIDFTGGTLDSCSLNLAYDFDYYGDTTSQQTFNVYQMTDDIYHDSIYPSNKISQCYPSFASRSSIGTTSTVMHPRKSVILGTDTLRPQLRIPIQLSFAQQIFSQSPTGNLANSATFVQFIKGFYIESQTTSGIGALSRFNLLDTTTKLTFYYHTATDTTKFSFVVNGSAAYYSHFAHNFTGADPNLVSQLNNPGVNTSNEVYVSACAGVKTKIEFPYLNNLRNLGYSIAINKAELVIKADPSTATADLPINKQLYVVAIDSVGNQLLLTDMFENSVYYGGNVNTTTSEYRINIARYFEQLLSGLQPNNGLYLKEIDPDSQGRRVVLGSSNSNSGTNNYRMYLHLVYTRIN